MTKEKPATTPSKPTVFGPHNNEVVNLNQPFPGQVTNPRRDNHGYPCAKTALVAVRNSLQQTIDRF
jgi:hypothetical protein